MRSVSPWRMRVGASSARSSGGAPPPEPLRCGGRNKQKRSGMAAQDLACRG